jgi:hypothetical protein
MAEDHIRYDILAQDALRGVVRKVLSEVARTGLPGEHHFYISFRTQAPGVRISSRMLEKYPEEMTIVLQHQFWDLKVDEHAFEVGLSFGAVPERLLVPFTAVKGFIDPSVQFALQFEPVLAAADADPAIVAEAERGPEIPAILRETAEGEKDAAPEPRPAKAGDDRSADIVSIDAFRKKS